VEQNQAPSALSYFVFRKMDPCFALRWWDLTAGILIDWVMFVKMEMKQEMYCEKHNVDHSISLFTPNITR
jgi:hypothetical protein